MAGVLPDGGYVGEAVGARAAGALEGAVAVELHIEDCLVGRCEQVPLVASLSDQAVEARLASATAGIRSSATTRSRIPLFMSILLGG
jgi:hypothetical protein